PLSRFSSSWLGTCPSFAAHSLMAATISSLLGFLVVLAVFITSLSNFCAVAGHNFPHKLLRGRSAGWEDGSGGSQSWQSLALLAFLAVLTTPILFRTYVGSP